MQDKLSKAGVLTIDLGAMADNYRQFQKVVGADCAVAGVVKADAYGTGLKPVVETLTKLDCPQFFVATLDEAIQLRAINDKTPVAVLGGLYHGAEKEYQARGIWPVLNSPEDIQRWGQLAREMNQALPAILHIDTGMNRLGLSAGESKMVMQSPDLLEGISVQILMSHFASADSQTHPQTQAQADAFAEIMTGFAAPKKSLANSSGTYRNSDYHYDMVRPGYALYGGNPTPETDNPVKPVVSLSARILQIRDVGKGETIGYSATHEFDDDAVCATVGLGYADGFLRSGSSRKTDSGPEAATLFWQGQPCPIVGRVSMDLVSVDLTNINGPRPVAGDSLEILGPHQGVDDLAEAMGTIGYEILTSLGARYAREYV